MMKNKPAIILFVLIVAIQLTGLVYFFAYEKEGCHSDELWAYGFANSYHQPQIYEDTDGNPKNCNAWLPCSNLKDYLVVNDGEEFCYESVIFNKMTAISPPLHSLVLHTICSFFPNQFSRWYAFSINIVSFLVTMIFLFLCGRVLKDNVFAILLTLFYGFSMGCSDNFLYLRLYSMGTMFTVVALYFILKYFAVYEKTGKLWNANLIGLWIASVLGFLTNYYVVSILGLATFFICLYLLCRKRIKQMFLYGFGMLGSLGVFLAFNPYLITNYFMYSEETGTYTAVNANYTFAIRFDILLNFITMKILGIHHSMFTSGFWGVFWIVFAGVVIVCLPLLYLFRNEPFMKKAKAVIVDFVKHFARYMQAFLAWLDWRHVIIFIVAILQMIIVGETSKVYGMGEYEDRYIFFLYPLVCINILGFIYLVAGFFKKKYIKTGIIAIAMLALLAVNLYDRTVYEDYLFREEHEGPALDEVVRDRDFILVNAQLWEIVSASEYLMYGDSFFHVTPKDYMKYTEEYKQHIGDKPLIFIINMENMRSKESHMNQLEQEVNGGELDESIDPYKEEYYEIMDYFENLVPETQMKKIASQKVFGREFISYIINP